MPLPLGVVKPDATTTSVAPPGPVTSPAVEEVVLDLEFIEEPLGLLADQRYGFLQVDFGESIGPEGRFQIVRKLAGE